MKTLKKNETTNSQAKMRYPLKGFYSFWLSIEAVFIEILEDAKIVFFVLFLFSSQIKTE